MTEPSSSLIRAYVDRREDLVRVFAGRLRSRARAEDLVQAMFEKLTAISPEEPIASPLAYLYRLGSNLMLDDIRQDRRRRARDAAWSELQGLELDGVRASDAPDPHRTSEGRERLRQMLAIVETFPGQTRRVFQMHKLQGLSHAETARALGISTSAVEKHVSLALRLLTERMG